MKTLGLMMIVAATGRMALAQGAPGFHASVTNSPPMTPTAAINAQNDMRAVLVALHPIEERIAKTDPDIVALTEQCKAAQRVLLDLDKQRRDLLAAWANSESAFWQAEMSVNGLTDRKDPHEDNSVSSHAW